MCRRRLQVSSDPCPSAQCHPLQRLDLPLHTFYIY